MAICKLKDTIETLENLTVILFKSLDLSCNHGRRNTAIHNIEQRLVIFVYENHSTPTCFLVSFLEHVGYSVSKGLCKRTLSVFLFLYSNKSLNSINEFRWRGEVLSIEVKMKHWILLPLRLKTVDGKSFEEVLTPLEVVFQC